MRKIMLSFIKLYMVIYKNRDSVMDHVPFMISASIIFFHAALNNKFSYFSVEMKPTNAAVLAVSCVLFGTFILSMFNKYILFKNVKVDEIINMSKQVSAWPAAVFLVLSIIALFI